jgi:Fe-S-cluster containining protein
MSDFIVLQDNAAQSVLCSVCPDPGACCRLFDTSAVYWDDADPDEVDQYMASQFSAVPWKAVMPGREKYTSDSDDGRVYSNWLFTCPKLVDGRCSIYATRPDGCRHFVPELTGSICVFHPNHHRGIE